jgi:hypothetical protein
MKALVVLLSIIFVCFQGLAEESARQGDSERVTSQSSRAGKKFTATYQIVGVGPSSTFANGVALGFFLEPDWIIMLEGTRGREATVFDIFDDTDVESTSIGIHAKNFAGNSFYYRFGVDYRDLEYQYTDNFLTTTRRTFDSQSWAVSLNIGNQWQFKNFTIGCDWVGVTLPLSKKYSNESVATTGNLATEQQENEDAKEDLTERTQINLLRFYLGASF